MWKGRGAGDQVPKMLEGAQIQGKEEGEVRYQDLQEPHWALPTAVHPRPADLPPGSRDIVSYVCELQLLGKMLGQGRVSGLRSQVIPQQDFGR